MSCNYHLDLIQLSLNGIIMRKCQSSRFRKSINKRKNEVILLKDQVTVMTLIKSYILAAYRQYNSREKTVEQKLAMPFI